MEKKIKVAQIGTGKMSVYTMRYVYEKGGEIVAAIDVDSDRIGKDISEIMGGEKRGVRISHLDEAEAVLKAVSCDILIANQIVEESKIKRLAKYCKANDFEIHPARMPKELPEFFIQLLTEENDLVLDPFGGSNSTGYIAEKLNRKWIAVEAEKKYIDGSVGRFLNDILK